MLVVWKAAVEGYPGVVDVTVDLAAGALNPLGKFLAALEVIDIYESDNKLAPSIWNRCLKLGLGGFGSVLVSTGHNYLRNFLLLAQQLNNSITNALITPSHDNDPSFACLLF